MDKSICSVISDRRKLDLDCKHLKRLVEVMWIIKKKSDRFAHSSIFFR